MRAVTYHHYGSPDVLKVEEVAKPTPGEDEVLLKLHAAAITTADIAARKGDPFLMRFFIGLRGPKKRILGTEFAGQVEAVGSKVTRFAPGDQVWAATGVEFGAHADYLSLPEDGALAHKPESLTYEDATSISEGALTALPFLRDKGRIKPGQRVLINGASGSVGTSAVQLAKAFGAEVTAVCSAANVELVRSLGADEIIDYTTEDFTSNGRTYDIIFDAVGKSSFSKCKDSLSERGVYLTTVLSRGTLVQGLWTAVFGRKKAVFSATGLRKPADKARDLEFLSGLVEQGSLRPVIDRSYSLEQAAEAHRYVEAGHKKGNVIFNVMPPATATNASPPMTTV